MPICWLCRKNEADSREHKFKRADLKRNFGTGPWKGGDTVMHFSETGFRPVQGPNGKTAKYEPSLCAKCNNSFTQNADFAYDTFMNFVFANSSEIIRKRIIPLEDVFGSPWERDQVNLYRYFAKSFGCQLVHAGRKVPRSIRWAFYNDRFPTKLTITFSVIEELVSVHNDIGSGPVGFTGLGLTKGDLFGDGYVWRSYVNWLCMSYYFKTRPHGPVGAPWVGNGSHLYLGSTEIAEDSHILEPNKPLLDYLFTSET